MFDFNTDLAQEFGVYKNENAYEIAKYVSSVNVSAGFHAGDPISIKNALAFVRENNLALGAHIGYPDISGFGKRSMELNPDEIEAMVLYQLGAVSSFAKTMSLEIEHVRCHGAMNQKLSIDRDFALSVALAVKKINPWLNLFIQNYEMKLFLEDEAKINCAYEVNFTDNLSVRQLREMETPPQTVHFFDLENAKRAYDVIKPFPVNYIRVMGQV
ncbi:MAG: LamB/YcsF family protein [Candidatus Gastranaerophilales bacterium]|nr:LamB/YcsF family protein [Candidatus Gastranaerophilales bacterium]